MTNDDLLKELQKRQLLEEAVIGKLKREAFLSGRSVEQLLYERHLVEDVKLAEIKAAVLGVPYQKINVDALNDELIKLVPEETVRNYGVVPLSKQDNLLIVGMLHPDDVKAQDALKFVAKKERFNLGVYLISFGDWQEVLRKYSPYRSEIEEAIKSLHLKEGGSEARKLVELEGTLGAGAEDAPIIRIVANTLREAVQIGASDVHIEPQESYLRVRFRLDGDLREVAAIPLEIGPLVISRIKVISNLKIDETRVPQDGRFRSKIFDREVDFRIATFPTPLGEKVAIRVLDPSIGLRNFESLALLGRNSTVVKKSLEEPYGMLLITGPTGSGKSTTLYALLQTLNKEEVNIISLEDPVEYFVSGINQSQVQPEIGYDFASGLRQILRQDPDVIMVGEIRDNETAGLAVHAALTGHIVLSTLHTNNSLGVIPRLVDMGVEPFLLPAALNLMMAQRLISQLCEHCKVAVEGSREVQKLIESALKGVAPELIKDYKPPYKIYHAPGCTKCHDKGVNGRIALYEVFEMTRELEAIINEGPTGAKILAESNRQGILRLRQDGTLKALAGLVSFEEVVRETEEV